VKTPGEKGSVLIIDNSQRLSKHPVQQQKPHVKMQAINAARTGQRQKQLL